MVVFSAVISEMFMIYFLLTCSVDNEPSVVYLELIDMQLDTLLGDHLTSVSMLDFYYSKNETFSCTRSWLSLDLPIYVNKFAVMKSDFSALIQAQTRKNEQWDS